MRFRKDSIRQARWISTGFRRSFHEVTRWVSAGNDKAHTRKRLTILGCSATGIVVFSSEYPKVALTALPLCMFLLCAWFGRWPHEEMTMHPSDYEAPTEAAAAHLQQTAPPSDEDALLRFVQQYPTESAGEIAARLSEVSAPRTVTEEDVIEALAQQGVTLPGTQDSGLGRMRKLLSRS